MEEKGRERKKRKREVERVKEIEIEGVTKGENT